MALVTSIFKCTPPIQAFLCIEATHAWKVESMFSFFPPHMLRQNPASEPIPISFVPTAQELALCADSNMHTTHYCYY
jgi:hypothetical protein